MRNKFLDDKKQIFIDKLWLLYWKIIKDNKEV